MSTTYLLVKWLHVLVMGYWIGSDLVINQYAHYTAKTRGMPGTERARLWNFLMHVDQHPRNALILSLPLGLTLAAYLGLSPVTGGWLVLAWALSALWFWQMWLVHLKSATPAGPVLRAWDWRIRYVVIGACAFFGLLSLATGWPFATPWLALKVVLFGGVVACGLGIRHYIQRYLEVWPRAVEGTATDEDERWLVLTMRQATVMLALLHVQVIAIGLLGVLKPG